MSSPHYHQSNGNAEIFVKKAKKLLQANDFKFDDSFHKRLNMLRLTPITLAHKNLYASPVEILYGQTTRSLLPTLPSQYQSVNRQAIADEVKKYHSTRKVSEDRRSRPLSLLRVGQNVFLQCPTSLRWTRSGTVSSVRPHGRSYVIRLDNGRHLTRNRKLLRPAGDSRGHFKNVQFCNPLQTTTHTYESGTC